MAHEQQVFDFFSMPKVQLTETDPHRKLSQIHNITPRKDVRTSHCSEHGSNGIQYCSTPKKNPEPVQHNKKTNDPTDDEKELARRTGKLTAREFIAKNSAFPNKEDFVVDDYEYSFSSILERKICQDSYLKDEKHFAVFFLTNIPYWFKCCNEARADLVCKSKDRYFSKFARIW